MAATYDLHISQIDSFLDSFAKKLRGGEIIALIGTLGAGKTTFTQKLGKRLGVTRSITSPTYILLQSFPGKLSEGKVITLYHLDLYRTDSFAETEALGLTEFWGQPDSITVMEWADKIKAHLPKPTITITLHNS